MIEVKIVGKDWDDVVVQMQGMVPDIVPFEPKPEHFVEGRGIDMSPGALNYTKGGGEPVPSAKETEDDGFVTVHPEPEKKEEKPKRKRRTKAEIEAEKAKKAAGDDPREECRALLTQIEAKHKAEGLVKASGAIKDVLDAQGGEYDKPKMSNVEDGSLGMLKDQLVFILGED